MSGLSAFRAFVQEVRDRSDLVEVIGRDVPLRRVGAVLKGLSPFHPEKHPSFVVWPTTQTWRDFSNGDSRGGDVFTYVQEREKLNFKEAVLLLAERAGIRRPDQDDEAWKRAVAVAEERREIERLFTLAAGYYHRALPPEIRAEHYQRHYGFTDETIDGLQLGWADGGLFKHLTATTGLARGKLLATGLFYLLRDGRIVDYFRHRLVFPYWSRGRVVYFTARTTRPTDQLGKLPKYIKLRTHGPQQSYISPTIRNDYLFNEDAARGADEIVITEGIPDCISARQCGIACVSPGTTSFREQDLPRLLELSRGAKRIVLCNDAEASGAGDKSARNLAADLWAAGREVYIASIPRPPEVEKIDLNELVVAHGADGLRAVLDAALPFLECLVAQIPTDTPRSELDRRLEPVFDAISRCPPLRADATLDAITTRFGLRRRALLQGVKQRAQARGEKASTKRKPAAGTPAAPAANGGAADRASGTPPGPPRRSPRPEICVTGRQLYDLVLATHAILATANARRIEQAVAGEVEDDEAPLFRRGNVLARLERPEAVPPRLAQLTEPEVYGVIMREIDWVRETQMGTPPVYPPDKVARDLHIHPRSTFPRVNSVITTPVFGHEGDLLVTPGLHVRDRVWLDPDPSLQLENIPGHPTPEDIATARSLFFDNLLVDFRFDQPADRTHALAALLLPFLRRMIDGCTPLHVMEAPAIGSGKSLLCKLVSILLTGEEGDSCTLPANDDDIRKLLTAELVRGRPLILLDNADEKTTLSAPSLAALLTTRSWTDRVLGRTQMVTVPNQAMWMFTGNNPKLSRDIARRSIRIRIDPRVDHAWLRSSFKHDPLEQWAKAHRRELVHAALVLIQAWIAAGRPLSRARLGSFQVWASVMGGVLDVAGVEGFLGNLDALYAHADGDAAAWREFTQVWWATHRDAQVHVSVLRELCDDKGLLSPFLGDGTARAQQVRLGRALQRVRDRVFGDLRVVMGGADRDSRTLYSLQQVDAADPAASTCGAPCIAVEPQRSAEAHWVPYADEDDTEDAS